MFALELLPVNVTKTRGTLPLPAPCLQARGSRRRRGRSVFTRCSRKRQLQLESSALGEADRWSSLSKATIEEHTDSAGVVNEFSLLYALRTSFPLHYIVFKQTAAHIPHEGNSEQIFSRAGNLSDDNAKMDPTRLGVWTSIGVNYDTFQPSYVEPTVCRAYSM